MIGCDYYSLADAAKHLSCCANDLLHFGALGRLSIYFLPAGLQLVSEKYADNEIIEKRIIDTYEPLKLSRHSLELLEAGNNDAFVMLDYESDTTHKVRRFTPIFKPDGQDIYDFTAMFGDPVAYAEKMKRNYNDVKISDVKLVIKHDELMKLCVTSKSEQAESVANIGAASQTDTVHVIKKLKSKNEKRLNKLNEWYEDLCVKQEKNRVLIIKKIDELTNDEIKKELMDITPSDEKYLWANGADRWIMDNGESVWEFKRTQGSKSKKSR